MKHLSSMSFNPLIIASSIPRWQCFDVRVERLQFQSAINRVFNSKSVFLPADIYAQAVAFQSAINRVFNSKQAPLVAAHPSVQGRFNPLSIASSIQRRPAAKEAEMPIRRSFNPLSIASSIPSPRMNSRRTARLRFQSANSRVFNSKALRGESRGGQEGVSIR